MVRLLLRPGSEPLRQLAETGQGQSIARLGLADEQELREAAAQDDHGALHRPAHRDPQEAVLDLIEELPQGTEAVDERGA